MTRGAEMATNAITVLSKYGYHGYKGDQHLISPYNVNPFSSEVYLFVLFSALLSVVIHL